MRRHARRDEFHDRLCRRAELADDESLRHFSGFVVVAWYYRGVGNSRMSQQHGLKLGRRNLKTFVLNQLLYAIDDEEVALFVSITNVAGMQPIVGVDRARSRLLIIEIAFHDLRPAHANLALLIRTKLDARGRI